MRIINEVLDIFKIQPIVFSQQIRSGVEEKEGSRMTKVLGLNNRKDGYSIY